MAAFLSEDWLGQLRERGGELPVVPAATLAVQHVVTGAPGGKVHVVTDIRDGRVVDARLGRAPDAACTVTWAHRDLAAVVRGDLDLDVAYMRGDVKVDGDYAGFLLRLRPMVQGEAGEAFVASVRATTDW
jgi:hypothetical protein